MFGYAFIGIHPPVDEALKVYLEDIENMARQINTLGERAANAGEVDEIKDVADQIFERIWGMPSGLRAPGRIGAVSWPGWKSRWQVDFSDFARSYEKRYGSKPPEIEDPRALGMMGRGRAARALLEKRRESWFVSKDEKEDIGQVIAALNNVIGWTSMEDGVTKGERQPRVDLTRMWDAPREFWNSTADTGWLFEVQAQAINILKVDYQGDLVVAQRHVSDLETLAQKVLYGVDADGDGAVEPVSMEGGVLAAVSLANAIGVMQ